MEFVTTFSRLAGDFSFVLIFLAIALSASFFLGRVKLLCIMIDVYIARALVSVIPNEWVASIAYSDIVIFFLLFGFLFLIDQRLFDLHISARATGFFLRIGVMGVLVTGMVVSSILNYLPEEMVLKYLSQSLSSYFVSDGAQLFWVVAPLLVLVFINRKRRD